MKYKDLPADIKAIAYQRAKEQNCELNEETELGAFISFIWEKTKEGEDIWINVDEGNFAPFYEFHKIAPEYSENNLPNQYDEVEVRDYQTEKWNNYKYFGYNKKEPKQYYFVALKDNGCLESFKYCRPIQSIKMTVAELVQFASETKGKKVEVIE